MSDIHDELCKAIEGEPDFKGFMCPCCCVVWYVNVVCHVVHQLYNCSVTFESLFSVTDEVRRGADII
jgi:hypothetical protein